jgi:hypothetical protein
VADRIRLHRTGKDGLGVDEATDFALAFWMLYEVPDQAAFLAEVKPGSRLLVVEPRLHVSGAAFERPVAIARGTGQLPVARPAVALSRAVLFSR